MRGPCSYAFNVEELDFEAIFERYHQALYRFCLSILGNAEDAREALQNTMVKALRALPGEEREIDLKPWLYRVARNESIDMLRRRRDRVELDPEAAGAGGGPAEEAESRERLRALLADLGDLPERQRAALVMRELGGLEFAEIGDAFDTSASVARQTVYEARLSLQQLKAGREMSCEKVRWELSGEDGRVTRRRDIQAHLRDCAECRAFRDAIGERRRDLAALAPLPAAASAGLLHAVLGGKAGAAATGGAVGKLAATSTLVKSVATLAVVAAVAVPAADRGGLIHTGLFGSPSVHAQAGRVSGDASARTHANARVGAPGGDRQPGASGLAVKATPSGKAGGRDAGGRGAGSGEGSPQAGGAQVESPAADQGRSGPNSDQLPAASAHGQQTAAAHGGGRASAGSRGQGGSHAPDAPPAHQPSHPAPPPHPSPKPEDTPATQPPVQAPAVTPDKGGEPPFQPTNGNSGKPEEAGAGKSKEAR